MIGFLGALIANGSVYREWGYQPWLPFYNFGICMLTLGVMWAMAFFTTSGKLLYYSKILFISSFLSLILTYTIWTIMSSDPISVFINWGVLLMIFSALISRILRRKGLDESESPFYKDTKK